MQKLPTLIAALLLGPTIASAQNVTFDVKGGRESVEEALRAASLVATLNADENLGPQDYIAAARADYRRLLTGLYAQGYYGGTISILVDGREAADIAPLAAPDTIQAIVLRVDPGPRFTFGDAVVAPLPQGTVLPGAFREGRTARASVIGQAVSTGTTAWRDAGHAKVSAGERKITARHDTNTLDATVTLTPGPQLTFGAQTVTGNVDVRTARVLAIAGLPEGKVYSPAEIAKAERRLRETGAFDSATIVESKDIAAGNSLPVDLQVVESKPRRFGFGLELSSVEGLKVSSYWMHRNFLGAAERFRIDGDIAGISGETGGIDYALGASYERPAVEGPDTDFYLRGRISRDDEPDYLIDQVSIEAGFTRLLRDELNVQAGVGVLTAREVTQLGTRGYTLLTLPLAATLDRRNVPTDATEGYFLNLRTTPFYDTDNDLVGARAFGDARAFRSFGDTEQLTFGARVQLGSVMGTTVQNAPADFLFYSGGGGTVRGQPYKDLGVNTTVGGQVVRTGGLSFAGAQMEARYAVTPKIGLVGFYDIGQVSADASFGSNAQWHAGAGLGVRYETGIGPIRLDLGTPASGTNVAGNLQVYIGIGQSF